MSTLNRLFFIIMLIVFIGACSSPEQRVENYPNAHLLIFAGWLVDHLDDDNVMIVDMRSEGFEEGHIPGAVSIPGVSVLHDAHHPVPFFLKAADDFAQVMSERGIRNDHKIIIYDEGNSLQAARLFYALELYGHNNTHILNGGFAAWQAMGAPLSTSPVSYPVSQFRVAKNEGLVCDARYIQERINDPNTIVFDARSEAEFRGEDVRSERGGHIPGAVNLEWSRFIYNDENQVPFFRTFENISEILAESGITPDKEVITHCHTNVRGSHAYFTLRLMGYDSVRPYEGSWAEYGNLPNAHIAL